MSTHLDELRNQYPGQLVLTAEKVAVVLGRAKQTVYNQVAKEVFPVRVIKQQGKAGGWGCSIVDLAHYLDTGEPYTLPTPEEKPKRGRKANPLLVLKPFYAEVIFYMKKAEAEAEKDLLLSPFASPSAFPDLEKKPF